MHRPTWVNGRLLTNAIVFGRRASARRVKLLPAGSHLSSHRSFVATNVVLKPHLDRFINQVLAGALAAANGDPILQSIHFSLDEDARWHREWTRAVLDAAIADTATNASVVSGWVDRWYPLASAAIEAFATVVAHAPVSLDPAEVTQGITTAASDDLHPVLEPPQQTGTTGTGTIG